MRGQAEPGFGLEILHRGFRQRQILAGFFGDPIFVIVGVVLVFDLAHDLLDQILDGDKPINPAIFVDHQRHMLALGLHLLQQHPDRHRGWHV